ncbi:MAG: hypothetical protein IIA45_09390 [Bacteroidetes bacterium]|nr:hypothetical protein [Bacteroidota bacterium]
MKNYLFIALVLIFFSFTQDFHRVATIDISGQVLSSDNLRNCYVINDNNELIKFNADGERIASFSDTRQGRLQFIDSNNPLGLLLFYPDFSYIVLLDKSLSVVKKYNLGNFGISRAGAVCFSNDNNIWVYDENSFQLKKINNTSGTSLAYEDIDQVWENELPSDILISSEDLSMRLGTSLNPNFVLENGNWIYLNDPELGIIVLDIYANYFKTIPIKGLENFQIFEDELYYFNDNKLKHYNLKIFQEEIIELPIDTDIKAVNIQKDRLFILSENQLVLYSF